MNTVRPSTPEDLLYPREYKHQGLSWEDWTVKWWQWLLSIPLKDNPGMNIKDEWVELSPAESDVVFLVGAYAGSVSRKCVIPNEKSILVPIITFTTSYVEEPHLKTESDLILRARYDINGMTRKEAMIDGITLSDVEKYRVQSPVFDLVYPLNNVWNLSPGHSRAISDGYWLFLRPLNPGRHHIHTGGSCSSGKTNIDAMWDLVVRENEL
jgi:hypothetical protein